jgi:hypothetical protein
LSAFQIHLKTRTTTTNTNTTPTTTTFVPMADNQLNQAPAPAPNAPIGDPATLPAGRDLAAERDAEMRQDAAAAAAKASRFTVRRRTAITKPAPSGPEYETIILKAAANNPMADVDYPAVSTYHPNLALLFFVLHMLDQLMASTKRWLDNSAGWAPPISQMYVALLAYVQIARAQHAAGDAPHDMILFLQTFERIFPLSELWIPGPLVAAFRALSAFRPDENDLFGGVTPSLPASPGWSAAHDHSVNGNQFYGLPNIAFFISRLRDICAIAASGVTDAEWLNHTNGPLFIESLCGHPLTAANAGYAAAPGIKFAYSADRDLWRRANARLAALQIPARLNANTAVRDTWTAFFFFEDGQHQWFSNVSAIMAKYCQFFNGSKPLSELNPVNSAAGAVKIRFIAGTDLFAHPAHTAEQGTHDSHQHGNANQVNHVTCVQAARAVLDADLAVRDVPDAHIFSATTFCLNAYHTAAQQNANRHGPFWNLGPNVKQARNVEILPGLYSTIMREYHSDTRIPADKQ